MVAKIENKTQELANLIHEFKCTYNHTDYCGWFYENSWNDSTHSKYLNVAQVIIDSAGTSAPIEIFQLLNNNKRGL